MFDKDVAADLMVRAWTIYRRRAILAFDKNMQDEALRKLHKYGILSLSALGTTVGVSLYRVEKAISGTPKPTARGHLNPEHLSMLMYALSNGDIPARWVADMVEDGTSISTIADLTGISEATLYRRKDAADD